MAQMGRPRKEIKQDTFEKLCALFCTEEEIADFFDCTIDTINNWCKRTYNDTFLEVYRKKKVGGKISLRRSQIRLAEKSAAMAIFLGKNYLGQKDDYTDTNEDMLSKLDEVLARIKGDADAVQQ